jgi:hypothetical protein
MTRRRMYAVSRDGLGLIAGTLGYSRRKAIELFCFNALPGTPTADWGQAKRAGYRTVQALVEITGRYGTRRTTQRGR